MLKSSPFQHFVTKNVQKQPSRGVIRKRCSENMQQIYRRKPMQNVISINFKATLLKSLFGIGVIL